MAGGQRLSTAPGRGPRVGRKRIGRTLAALTFLVVLAHLLTIEWMARNAPGRAGLEEMAEPMFTRVLQPEDPAPLAATPPAPPVPPPPTPQATVVAAAPEPAASSPQPAASSPQAAASRSQPDAASRPVVAEAPVAAETASASAASPSTMAAESSAPATGLVASAPTNPSAAGVAAGTGASPGAASAASPPAAEAFADTWPPDTRVTYVMSGQFRGNPLNGSARVQWQRQGTQYQARVEISLFPFGSAVFTSQGAVTLAGLAPQAFEEARGSRKRVTRFLEREVVLHDGRSLPRPEGLQDMASQFVEIGQRFRTGRAPTDLGSTLTLPLVRPGGVDSWTFDIFAHEMVQTPRMGELETVRVTPRPYQGRRGTLASEIWFAPRLQYLPVRFKVTFGEEAALDLVVQSVEQR